ncbi:MAG: sigma 54-interacting transcriptional regulator [Planctomycetaceae bacterium]|jgi:DNA-binding NtrC family response regulator|nr:sigma 54-interacting transcriptional regulator [Planctomycetaceae bacterium]
MATLFLLDFMSKHISISRLSRLLQDIATPVYVLDEKQTLAYFNEPFVQWVNGDAEKLLGQRCRYHVSGSRLHHEIIAAAIAPPPEILRGERGVAILAVDAIRETRYRRAEFLPLKLEDGTFGTFVFIDENDLSREDAARFSTSSAENKTRGNENAITVESARARELHRVLFAVRRRQAGQYRLERMIGAAPQMQTVRRQAKLAAETVAPVLILGPPGSGRESLAYAIHFGRDEERSGGLIPIDCHSLPAELIDSAIRAFYQRYSKPESKRRHTLLLNNADLLESAQGELVASILTNNSGNMRVIGTSRFEPSEWQNSPQLPYLLATLQIRIPPLSERRGDIPLLAQWFLEQKNAPTKEETFVKENEPPIVQRTGFAADAMDLLMLYSWSGNLDELAAVVGESHANATGTLIRAKDLPIRLHYAADAKAATKPIEKIDLEKYLQTIEIELIQRALKISRANKAKAARLLGMTRPRLYRRLEQLGLLDVPDAKTQEKLAQKQKRSAPDFKEISDSPDFRPVE